MIGRDLILIDRADALLNQAACQLIVASNNGGSAALAALIGLRELLGASEEHQLSDMLRLLADIESVGGDRLATRVAALEESWAAWKAGQIDRAPAHKPLPLSGDEIAMLAADPELTDMFVAEALDHLSSIEALILRAEGHPDDAKLLDDIFRPFHTIKGNAGALGVSSVQAVAHCVESLLELARSREHAIGPEEVSAVLRAVDVLTALVQSIPARIAGRDVPDVGATAATLVADIGALLGRREIAMSALLTSEESAVVATLVGGAESVPVAQRTSDVDAAGHVRVDTRKLDSLVDMVGELVIVQSLIQQDPALLTAADDRLARNLAQLKRITGDLQRTAMSVRMTPIRPTFQKVSRLVRDLSSASGKNVALVLSGEDTELDRKVVEHINDPLMHMVRNSLDHGIESPEARKAAGKPREARLSLSAYHEGGSMVIAIADDGAGLATERIRAKAVEQGLIAADAALAPAEVHELIFRPGFSTAQQVTEISGRGVGMDVVRRNIEVLRGRIEIQSTPGVGTTFIIRLPLTLAIVEGLLLRCGNERFLLPTFSVRESLRPARSQVHSLQGQHRLIQVRNQFLPLVHLAELFGDTSALPEPWDATVVLVEDNGRTVGLVVDELLAKQEVVVKSLGDAFAGVRGIAGGAILGDGRVGLILDAGGLVSLMERRVEHAA
jgi:two-component system chemotaxis sensor kinase CheA